MDSAENNPCGLRFVSLRYLRRLFGLAWEASPILIAASIGLRLVRALNAITGLWISKLIIDSVVAWTGRREGSLRQTYILMAAEVGVVVAADIMARANTLSDGLLGDRFTNLVSMRLMRHAMSLDIAAFENPVFHDKLERARRQTNGRMSVVIQIMNTIQDICTVALMGSGLVVYSPWLVLLLVATVIPSFVGETRFSLLAYYAALRRTPQRRRLDYLRMLGASSQCAKEVKLFGLGKFFTEAYNDIARAIESENDSLAIRRALAGGALSVVSTLGYYSAYAVALGQALTGVITIGAFTFLAGLFARSRSLLERIFSGIADVSEQALNLKDLFDFFDLRPAIAAPANAIPAPRPIRDGFEFRNVTFGYPGSSKAVVSNIQFRIHAGERVALVGKNGAGKTTLVKLLTRLYDPSEGQILLDGIDLREYDIDDLRKEVGVIFQDYMRYDATVRENIGYGKIDALWDRERVRVSASKALATQMIEGLPLAYDQMLGGRFEGGVELSGGEWQRLALARAYLRDAQVLILDEPTAVLDARAEYEAFQRFYEITAGKMAVLISHRFSTVRMADRILVLSEGKILEQGSHRDLVSAGGHYASLFDLQAAGYR